MTDEVTMTKMRDEPVTLTYTNYRGETAERDRANAEVYGLADERERWKKRAEAAEANLERAREALDKIAEHLPLFDYIGSDEFGLRSDLPGSPYDRGKADMGELLSGIARAALDEIKGDE